MRVASERTKERARAQRGKAERAKLMGRVILGIRKDRRARPRRKARSLRRGSSMGGDPRRILAKARRKLPRVSLRPRWRGDRRIRTRPYLRNLLSRRLMLWAPVSYSALASAFYGPL